MISITIKYKLKRSSKMPFAFLYPQDITVEGWGGVKSCSLHHYDAMRTKIDMWFTPKVDIADFAKETNFDEKLRKMNKKVTLNKLKHILVEYELNELSVETELLLIKGNIVC